MRGFFKVGYPSYNRILLIESGSHEIAERLLVELYRLQKEHAVGENNCLDILTCFSRSPETFDRQRGTLHRVTEPHIASRKLEFVRELVAARYTTIAIISNGEGTLRKWKWAIAAQSSSTILLCSAPSRMFVLNVWHIWAARARYTARLRRPNLSWVLRVASLCLAPFSIFFLALYAATLHLKRVVNRRY